MAKKKVRLLCDSYLGKANDVVSMEPDDLAVAKAAQLVDDDKAAVKHAESLHAEAAADPEAPLGE